MSRLMTAAELLEVERLEAKNAAPREANATAEKILDPRVMLRHAPARVGKLADALVAMALDLDRTVEAHRSPDARKTLQADILDDRVADALRTARNRAALVVKEAAAIVETARQCSTAVDPETVRKQARFAPLPEPVTRPESVEPSRRGAHMTNVWLPYERARRQAELDESALRTRWLTELPLLDGAELVALAKGAADRGELALLEMVRRHAHSAARKPGGLSGPVQVAVDQAVAAAPLPEWAGEAAAALAALDHEHDRVTVARRLLAAAPNTEAWADARLSLAAVSIERGLAQFRAQHPDADHATIEQHRIELRTALKSERQAAVAETVATLTRNPPAAAPAETPAA